MRPRMVILKSVKLSPWMGTAIVFLATLPFWMWRPIRDSYFPYSGTVVGEGMQYDILSGEEDSYIIVKDARGVGTKRFVSSRARLHVGCFVVKKGGFREPPFCTPTAH
jgi:hypothetical protein